MRGEGTDIIRVSMGYCVKMGRHMSISVALYRIYIYIAECKVT